MKSKILDKKQLIFLQYFAKNKKISNKFYLTGGTALSEYFIPYRYSEDLDFFSIKNIKIDEIITFLKTNKNKIGFNSFEYNTSFNRNLFFLKYSDQELKTEFTYFPFPQIQKPLTKNGIKIDSVEDIAVNKLFTIYQKPRSRDFIDLYMICPKYKFGVTELIAKAKIKFDTHIDLVKLGSQFLKVNELKDYPKLIKPIKSILWQQFFEDEAKKLKSDIFKK